MNHIQQAYVDGVRKACAAAGLSPAGTVAMCKAAEKTVRFAKRKDRPDAESLLSMRPATVFADFAHGLPWGGQRAGRAESLGRAAGLTTEEIPFSVRHPQVQGAGYQLGGALLGGLAGGGLAAGIGAKDQVVNGRDFTGVETGGIIGAGLGGLIGTVIAAAKRRKAMRELVAAYTNADTVTPTYRESSDLAPLSLGIGTGPHALGREQAVRGMVSGDSERGSGHALGAAGVIPYTPTRIAGQAVQGVLAHFRRKELQDKYHGAEYVDGVKKACLDTGVAPEIADAMIKAAQSLFGADYPQSTRGSVLDP